MANKDAAFGLKPIGKVGQNRDAQGLSEYSIAANATAIYQNDPVEMLNTGDIVHYDKHAGHGIQWKDQLYYVLKLGDIVLVE